MTVIIEGHMEEKKHFLASRTIWGLILIAVGEAFEKQLGEISDVFKVVGLILAIIGRWLADKPLKV